MILAAGMGTRLQPLTDHIPKPALPLLNVSLLYYSLDLLKKAGVTELVVNTHHLASKIRELIFEEAGQSRLRSAFDGIHRVTISHEAPLILNSGGGIRAARTHLEGEDFFVVANGDEVLLPYNSAAMLDLVKGHRLKMPLATLLVMNHPEVGKKFGGVWCDHYGCVRGFGKTTPAPGLQGLHFTGFQVLSDRIFNFIGPGTPNIFYDVLTQAIAKGETVRVQLVDGKWLETGSPSDFLSATGELLGDLLRDSSKDEAFHEFLLKHWGARENFWRGSGCKGLTWANQKKFLDRGTPVLLGQESYLSPDVEVDGFVVVGSHVQLRDPVRITRSVITDQVDLAGIDELKNKIIIPQL